MIEKDPSETVGRPRSPHPCDTASEAPKFNSKAHLRELIQRHTMIASDLRRLHDMLPENPPAEQNEALWRLLINHFRL